MKKIKIMLVDDHQIVRDGLIKMIQEEPEFEVVFSTSSALDALDKMCLLQPDVIITDLSMPGLSGIDFTSKAIEILPETKILVLSMFVNEDYVIDAIKAGAKGYLPKQDSTTSVLVEAIRTLAAGDEYFSPSIAKVVMKSVYESTRNQSVADSEKKPCLTCREKEILTLFADGFSNQEIADKLSISVRTVKTHKNNIMQKYNFKSTVEMIKFALKSHIVSE